MDNFSVASAGQIEPLHEHVTRFDLPIPRIAIAFEPPLVMAITQVASGWLLTGRTTPQFARVNIAITLPYVAIAVVISTVARIVAPPRIVKHGRLR